MNLLKNILKNSKEIIITYILGYVIVFIACIIYSLLGLDNLDFFLNNGCFYILLVYYIIVILYIYHKNKKELNLELSLLVKEWYFLGLIGIGTAVFMNMIIFKLTSTVNTNNISLWLAFLSSGIIGPIYEEVLFRYLFYNRMKSYYSKNKSLFITSFIFSITHGSLISIIYAFFLGMILGKVYEDYKTIKAPIIVHVCANSIVLFLSGYNTYVLILSFICLLLGNYIYLSTFKKKFVI